MGGKIRCDGNGNSSSNCSEFCSNNEYKNNVLSSKAGVPSIMFGDLRIEPLSIGGATPSQKYDACLPFDSSSRPEHERQVTGDDTGRNSCDERNRKNNSSQRLPNNRLRPRPFPRQYYQWHENYEYSNKLKVPPPQSNDANNGSTNKNNYYHYFSELKPPPEPATAFPSMYKAHSQQLEKQSDQGLDQDQGQYHNHSTHARNFKPPPPQSPSALLLPLSSTLLREDPIPRVINVSNAKSDAPNNLLRDHTVLFPTSQSSSTFRKKNLISKYYPSKDAIEEQISKSFRNHLAADVNIPRKRTVTPTETNRNQVATITDTPTTAAPKTLKPPKRLESRPKKPLRVASLQHTQLRQQAQNLEQQQQHPEQQQQQHECQQHQTRISRQRYHLSHASSEQKCPQKQQQQHVYPPPLPSGNGITNGIATSTHTKTNALGNSCIIVPHQQEYDLQALLPNLSLEKQRLQWQQQARQDIRLSSTGNGTDGGSQNDANGTDISTNRPSPKPPNSQPISSFSASVKVEVYPGVFHVLRGGKDIALATERNVVMPWNCIVCDKNYSCVADAAYVICPFCEVIQSLTDSPYGTNNRSINNTSRWGVAVGSTTS